MTKLKGKELKQYTLSDRMFVMSVDELNNEIAQIEIEIKCKRLYESIKRIYGTKFKKGLRTIVKELDIDISISHLQKLMKLMRINDIIQHEESTNTYTLDESRGELNDL